MCGRTLVKRIFKILFLKKAPHNFTHPPFYNIVKFSIPRIIEGNVITCANNEKNIHIIESLGHCQRFPIENLVEERTNNNFARNFSKFHTISHISEYKCGSAIQCLVSDMISI